MNWPLRYEIKKFLKWGLILGIGLPVASWFFLPWVYWHGFELDYQNPEDHRFTIFKYDEIGNYEPNVYDASKNGENQLLTIKDQARGQNIFFLKSREHPNIDLQKITTESSHVKSSWKWEAVAADTHQRGLRDDRRSTVNLIYQWSPLLNTNPSLSDNSLTIKGLREVKHQETFTTPNVDIFYLRASFQDRIGFYKKNVSWWRFYPVPVFDFKGNADGAIAIVKSKQSGQTVIVIGEVPSYKDFNESEFRSIVESIQF